MATMQKLRAYQGPALFSYGFRPFFLFGAIYAGAMVPLWLVVFAGDVSLPTAFAPRDWHVHEMLFGYVCAVIAGFLLTAVPAAFRSRGGRSRSCSPPGLPGGWL